MDSSTLIRDIDGTTGAPYLTLSIYQTILSEIYKNYSGLSKGGVSTSTMMEEISAIEAGMDLLDAEYSSLDDASLRLYRQVEEYIVLAREQLNVIIGGA